MDNFNHNKHDNILFKKECYAIQGAIFDVYRLMGCGFLESVYQTCLENEFRMRNIPFDSQKEMKLYYKGIELPQTFKPDLICYDKIIVELKAVTVILPTHQAQLVNYLKATGMKLGLLVNFGAHPKASVKRFVK